MASVEMQTACQNAKNQHFWHSERSYFPRETCPRIPYFIMQQQFYPTKMQNVPALTWTNLLKSLGIPSNAVNILYNNNVCYFLKLPKFPPPPAVLIFLESVSFAMSAYTDNIRSLLMAIQNIYLICVLLLIQFSSSFLMSLFLSFVLFIFCFFYFFYYFFFLGGGGYHN